MVTALHGAYFVNFSLVRYLMKIFLMIIFISQNFSTTFTHLQLQAANSHNLVGHEDIRLDRPDGHI